MDIAMVLAAVVYAASWLAYRQEDRRLRTVDLLGPSHSMNAKMVRLCIVMWVCAVVVFGITLKAGIESGIFGRFAHPMG